MALRMTSARRSTRSAAGSGPALTALLLVKNLQVRSTLDWTPSNLVAFLRWNLLTYRNLWARIDGPCETPPLKPQPRTVPLDLGVLGQEAATASP